MKIAMDAGTKVSDRTIAPVRASTTVIAIGWNIFPSIPVSAKIGRYTAAMMNMPNRLGRMTSTVAVAVRSLRSSRVNVRPSRCCISPNRRRTFSMMMTAPSTISPKSSAPRLIRFPDTPPRTIPVMVNSMASGMTAAVMSAARKFPNSRNRTTITSKAPSIRFFEMVCIVRSTSPVRS